MGFKFSRSIFKGVKKHNKFENKLGEVYMGFDEPMIFQVMVKSKRFSEKTE